MADDGNDDEIFLASLGCNNSFNSIPNYLQRDPLWRDSLINTSTIGDVGCLLTSFTMALHHINARVDAASPIDPGALNQYLKYHNIYNGNCLSDRSRAVRTLGGLLHNQNLNLKWKDIYVNSRTDLDKAEEELEKALCEEFVPMIVGVKFRPLINNPQTLIPNLVKPEPNQAINYFYCYENNNTII
jgi:hypothetical protein